MASGDPPVTGNPAKSGMITFEAAPNTDTDPIPRHILKVRLQKNKRLELTIDPGTGNLVIMQVPADTWRLSLKEIN